MRVLCAWCLKENKTEPEALIGVREPLEDKEDSHGICPDHRRELENRVTQLHEELRRHSEMAERSEPWPKSSTLLQRISERTSIHRFFSVRAQQFPRSVKRS